MFPGASFKWRLSESQFIRDVFEDLFDWDNMYRHDIYLRGSIKKSIGESSLVYRNPAALSTTMNAANFRSFYEYMDIFHHDKLAAEMYEKREIEISHKYNRLSTSVNYFNNKTKNCISPVLNGQDNPLQNIGEIKNSGYNISVQYYGNFDSYRYRYRYFKTLSYGAILNFNRTTSKVTDVYDSYSVVPLAGFSNIATVFAKNEPLGAIYGTTYLRDEQGRPVIGDDGYPIVDEPLKKIGDPTPDFVLSLAPNVSWRDFKLSLSMEYSHGGQRWNGTRAYLDYLGMSEDRDWVRDGATGVGEEYIEDATYFRLSDITLSYLFKYRTFGRITVSLRAQNLLWITSYKGVNPSSSLFGYSTGNGLDLFNQPSLRTYSLAVSLKF